MMNPYRLLAIAALVALPLTLVHADDPRGFAGELTGITTPPAALATDAERASWEARQKATEAAASQALAQAQATEAAKGVAPGQLGPGDKVKMSVFGEEDLSGEFEVDSTGSLALPLIGEVKAKGLTPRELETKVGGALSKGYLVNPRVNIEVLNFRPFFILGEVNKPGSYPYVNDMTVINGVALGGGYTPRAKTGKVKLRRAQDPEHKEQWVDEGAKIYPGDVIQVDERFF
jgi:polysaccharide export outer membrane protein